MQGVIQSIENEKGIDKWIMLIFEGTKEGRVEKTRKFLMFYVFNYLNKKTDLYNLTHKDKKGYFYSLEEIQDVISNLQALQFSLLVVTYEASINANIVTKQFTQSSVKGTSNAPQFANQQKLTKHFDKHKGEFGNITEGQYLNKAQTFANSSGKNILTKTGTNGDILKFNSSTNEFSIVTKDNIIRTYHKLDPSIHGFKTNMDYWNSPHCNY